MKVDFSSVDSNRLPNLLIIGAQKSGTTSLAALLGQHSDVYISPLKEPHFLAHFHGLDPDFVSLKMPYSSNFKSVKAQGVSRIQSVDEYLNLFSGVNAKYLAEASPTNMSSPNAAEAIDQYFSHARLIAMLRNPYFRALSAYTYFSSMGREPCETFHAAIKHEISGGRDDWIYGFRYMYMSKYFTQLKRFSDHWKRGLLYVLKFEDFKRNENLSMSLMQKFLGLPEEVLKLDKVKNQTVNHSNPILRAMKSSLSSPGIRRVLPKNVPPSLLIRLSNIRDRAFSVMDSYGQKPTPDGEAAFRIMKEYIEPEIDQLEVFLQRDLSEWRFDKL